MKKEYFLFVFLCLISSLIIAQVPQQINYQGMLSDISGNPITGTYTINFSIYIDGTTTSSLWTETQTVTVSNGLFSVQLGFNNPIPIYIFDGTIKYLGVQVGTDPEMTPRQKLISVGYSFKAADAVTLNGLPSSSFADASHNHNSDYYTKPEINTDDGTPNQTEDPVSWTKIKDMPADFADGTDDIGSSTSGITQINGGNGITVTNPTGPTATVELNTNANDGAPNETDDPVNWTKLKDVPAGFADGVDNGIVDITVGGGLSISSQTGPNVAINLPLKNDLATNDGTINQTDDLVSWYKLKDVPGGFADGTDDGSSTVHNHFGEYWSNTNSTYGLNVQNTGDGNGIEASSGSHIGIFGSSSGNDGGAIGVKGVSPNGCGLYGEGGSGIYATGNAHGVYGISNSGYAVFGHSPYGTAAGGFDGNVIMWGTLTKTAGSFRIDHPLDPENKYLQHSFVESPDMKNIYDGTIVLNTSGEAIIELPDWFEALNKDFRYQITCIGGYAQIYVAEEITNNHFKIAGGTPSLKVSWMVTGIRKDAYANSHRIEVEIDKPTTEKGKYIFPELFGASEEAGINFEQHKKMEEMNKQHELNKMIQDK